MELIEASITAHVRPTTMILGEDNRKSWSEMDLLVMQAYQRYKNEMCSEHGGPLWLCRNQDLRLNVRAKERPGCVAIAEVRRYEEKHKDDDNGHKSAQPEFYMRGDENFDLVKLRRSYYEDFLAEQQGD